MFSVYLNNPDAYYTDLRQRADGVTWEWGDGSLLTYDPWMDGQPDIITQTVGVMSPGGNCKFFDGWNYHKRPFICEK